MMMMIGMIGMASRLCLVVNAGRRISAWPDTRGACPLCNRPPTKMVCRQRGWKNRGGAAAAQLWNREGARCRDAARFCEGVKAGLPWSAPHQPDRLAVWAN